MRHLLSTMMSEAKHILTIPADLAGERTDKVLTRLLADEVEGISRARLQSMIKDGQISPLPDPSAAAQAGAVFTVTLPPPRPVETVAEDIPLDVVYEDDDILVINKAAGLVVHPAAGHWQGTLVNALLFHVGDDLSGIGGEQRPGIVHRLDKDTSGLMVVAKNDAAHQGLTRQFTRHKLSRTYLAIVWGVPSPVEGTIHEQIGRDPKNRQRMAVRKSGGKDAITHYSVEQVLDGGKTALVRCELETGRTHQIRVHLAFKGHPLLGDPVYGGRRAKDFSQIQRQALHATALRFLHPRTGEEMAFEASPPADFISLLQTLGGRIVSA